MTPENEPLSNDLPNNPDTDPNTNQFGDTLSFGKLEREFDLLLLKERFSGLKESRDLKYPAGDQDLSRIFSSYSHLFRHFETSSISDKDRGVSEHIAPAFIDSGTTYDHQKLFLLTTITGSISSLAIVPLQLFSKPPSLLSNSFNPIVQLPKLERMDGAFGILVGFDFQKTKHPVNVHAIFTHRSLDAALTSAAIAASEVAERKKYSSNGVVTTVDTPSVITALLIAKLTADVMIENMCSADPQCDLLGLTTLSEPCERGRNRFSFEIGGQLTQPGPKYGGLFTASTVNRVSHLTLTVDDFGLATVSSN